MLVKKPLVCLIKHKQPRPRKFCNIKAFLSIHRYMKRANDVTDVVITCLDKKTKCYFFILKSFGILNLLPK